MQSSLRRLVPFIVGAVMGAAVFMLIEARIKSPPPVVQKTSHAGVTIDQVQALSSLVTMRVEVSDVVVTRLDGYTGGVEAAVLLRGDFELGIDLSAAKFEAVDETGHTASLLLPQPRVSQPRVDHKRTRVVAIHDKGLWAIAPGADAKVAITNLVLRDAQRFVEQSADDPVLKDRARRQAETVSGLFFRALGWTVQVRWQ